MTKNTGIKLNICMEGFKQYIESFADMAYYMSEDPEGPSPLEAIQDVFDVKKAIKIVDLLLGASKMILMLKPTLRNNLESLAHLQKALRHPKKLKYWKDFALSAGNVGKLALANPLVLFPSVSPLLTGLSPTNQAIILGALKVISSTYFYLTSLSDNGVNNPQLQELLQKIKPLLPDTGQNQSKAV